MSFTLPEITLAIFSLLFGFYTCLRSCLVWLPATARSPCTFVAGFQEFDAGYLLPRNQAHSYKL